MVTVRFYGALKQFGTSFKLDVQDTAEALRALMAQIPTLRGFLQQGLFTVRIGHEYLDRRYLEQGLAQKLQAGSHIHITPVLKGAKKAGLFQTIVGAVLVVVGALVPAAQGLIAVGIGLMVGGVAQMLTKMPGMPDSGKEKEKKQSTSFSNLSNLIAQGRPMPLAYGRIRTGSMIISQGVETMDTAI